MSQSFEAPSANRTIEPMEGRGGGPLDLQALLPYPPANANKYSRGKAVVCSGSAPYPGAAVLAAKATQLVGVGYTEAFTDQSNVRILQNARASLVVRPFSALRTRSVLSDDHPGAALAGSGMDPEDTVAQALVDKLLNRIEKPLVLDGGALSYAAGKKTHARMMDRGRRKLVTVVTPHRGEAARLGKPFGLSMSDDQERDARVLSTAYGSIVVLKGPNTVIADHGRTHVVTSGTPALAKAGSGDVLAGMVTGLLAQGVDPFGACVLAVELHASAGLIASHRLGIISVCAEDVLDAIPAAIKALSNGKDARALKVMAREGEWA